MFDVILLGLAVICMAYFIIIVLYAGIGTSFAFIWVFFAALCVFLVYGKWYYERNLERIPRWVPVSIVTTCIAGVTAAAIICLMVFLGAAEPAHPGLDYVIVLGARVKGASVSSSLKMRLDKAIEYAQRNPDTMLVLSGGRGPGEQISEAEAMRDYLVYNGVRPDRLLLEERSASTVENIAYSKSVIDRYRWHKKETRPPMGAVGGSREFVMAEDRPLEVGVLTSSFHVFRAKMIAKKWGFQNVYGIAARSDPVLFVHLCIRECASVVKDRLFGNM